MQAIERNSEIGRFLQELKHILESEGDTNWVRGITAALNAIEHEDFEIGFNEAKSIYKSMSAGNGSFSDYYIRRPNAEDQVSANRRLDDIRSALWARFQE